MPLALDDGELEEEEEELEFVRFPVLLFKSPPQWLHDVSTSLPPTHEDKEDEEGEETCI